MMPSSESLRSETSFVSGFELTMGSTGGRTLSTVATMDDMLVAESEVV